MHYWNIEEENEVEEICEVRRAKNFIKIMTDIKQKIQKTQRKFNLTNITISTHRYIIVKWQKTKREKILRSQKDKKII